MFLFYIEVNVGFALTDNATMCWEACLPKNSALIFSMNTIDILQTSTAATFIAAVSNILSSYEVKKTITVINRSDISVSPEMQVNICGRGLGFEVGVILSQILLFLDRYNICMYRIMLFLINFVPYT